MQNRWALTVLAAVLWVAAPADANHTAVSPCCAQGNTGAACDELEPGGCVELNSGTCAGGGYNPFNNFAGVCVCVSSFCAVAGDGGVILPLASPSQCANFASNGCVNSH